MQRQSLMFTAVATVCLAAASFLAVDANYGQDREKDMITRNLEALSADEIKGIVVGRCGGDDAYICSVRCDGCGQLWGVPDKRGLSSDVSGHCDCGYEFK